MFTHYININITKISCIILVYIKYRVCFKKKNVYPQNNFNEGIYSKDLNFLRAFKYPKGLNLPTNQGRSIPASIHFATNHHTTIRGKMDRNDTDRNRWRSSLKRPSLGNLPTILILPTKIILGLCLRVYFLWP